MGMDNLSESDFPDTDYRERRGEWGYCESYEVIMATPENMAFLMEKINELAAELEAIKEK